MNFFNFTFFRTTIVWAMLMLLAGVGFTQTINLPLACNCPLGPDPSTNGGGIVTSIGGVGCTGSGTINGVMTQGVAVSGVTMTLYANVTKIGTWSMSSTQNGVTFAGSGTFTTLGCQIITLTATGTPTSSGPHTWCTNTTPQGCSTATVQPGAGSIATLNCGGATSNGTLTAGTPATGVSSTIPYTGGNGGTHSGQTVASTVVTGLTATLMAGSFANGAGTLSYVISGTPATSGTANFAINIGGQSCTLSMPVSSAIVIPATITLAQNQRYFIASVNDDNYIPYTAPTSAASLNTGVSPDGTTELLVDILGTLTTTGVSVAIPVTATGAGTLPAYSQTINIPAEYTQNVISRNITLSWASQSFTATTKSITATLKAEVGTLEAKKLDINAGIGNDYLGVLMGQFTYPYNNAGQTTSYQVRDIPGIPDRRFGEQSTQGGTLGYYHNNLYLPVIASNGSIWLNNNLGADYSDLTSSSFNLTQQATASNDHRAYGSMFEWGRYSDGHELINWTGASSGTAVNGTTNIRFTTTFTNSNLFVTGAADWRNPNVRGDGVTWQSSQPDGGVTNPCPYGFRIPTGSEFSAVVAGVSSRAAAHNTPLKLTAAGSRFNHNVIAAQVNRLYYVTSTIDASNRVLHYYMDFDNTGSVTFTNGITNDAMSVRCIRN